MFYIMPKSRKLRRKTHLARRLEIFLGQEEQEKITLADVAKIILGGIITVAAFYSITVILFTL